MSPYKPLDPHLIACHFEQTLIRSVSELWETTLWNLNASLDRIETSISEDQSLAKSVNEFRYNLGIMRVYIPRMIFNLKATLCRLADLEERYGTSQDLLSPHEHICKDINTFNHLIALCESIVLRSEKVTQGLMAAMSMIESRNAIKQGHEVQKLTELAFIFIPMSFAASYFGMEVRVSFDVYTGYLRIPKTDI